MEKVQLIDSDWKKYPPNNIHSILSANDKFNSIVLSDGTTKLLDDVQSDDMSFLHIACVTGNVDVVKRLLNKEAHVNNQTRISFEFYLKSNYQRKSELIVVPKHSTALHIAAISDNKKIVKLLLDKGANIYAQNEFGLTPIHMSKSISIAKLFFKTPSELRESLSNHGLSHLHVAAYADASDVIKELLAKGANINSVYERVPELSFLDHYTDRTPLHVALKKNSECAIQTLIQNSADIFEKSLKGATAVQTFFRERLTAVDEKTVRYVITKFKHDERLKKAIDPSVITLLHVACHTYDFEWAKKLLEEGANVNAQMGNGATNNSKWNNYTPMHLLIDNLYYKSTEMSYRQKIYDLIELLLQHGAGVLKIGGYLKLTPLLLAHQHACTNYRSDFEINEEYGPIILRIADLLLDSHQSFTTNPAASDSGFSHFHYACMRNKVDAVKKFLDNGIDVNHTANLNFCREDHEDFGFGQADQNATDFTPLHLAIYYRSLEVARVLIERGADVNAVNEIGETPLHVAMRVGLVNFDLFEMMLSKGADFNARGSPRSFGSVIDYFLIFVKEKTYEQVKFFLDRGSSIDIETDDFGGKLGKAMRYAKASDQKPIFEAIINSPIIKSAIAKNFDAIESVVCIEHDGRLTLDFYLYAIQKLIDLGCRTIDSTGETVLDLTNMQNVEGIEALLSLGADINHFRNESYDDIMERMGSYSEKTYNVLEMLKAHEWKMKFVDLEVYEDSSLEDSEESFSDEYLLSQSEDELAKLSTKKITASLSMRDFLREWSAVIDYPTMSLFEKEKIAQFFSNLVDLRKDFPEFSGILLMQYRKALARQKMHKVAMVLLPIVMKVELPYLCLENILKYLNNDELDEFIEGQQLKRKIFVQKAGKPNEKRVYEQMTV